MSEYGYPSADDAQGEPFESERRGYNRRQVDEFIARRDLEVRDLESRLAQTLSQAEQLRAEVAEAHQAAARAPHEEISERVGQILKLAADEAKANRDRADAETADLREAARKDTDKLRADVKAETDKLRAEAQAHAEKLIAAAKEQAEHTLSASVAQAEQLTAAAKAEADRMVGEASSHAEKTVAAAIAQAKSQLDEATARATAVHDGAERRLNLLMSRHTETVRRLTEIRDVVTTLVAGEAARGSLEDEVNRALVAAGAQAGGGNGDGRPLGRGEANGAANRTESGGGAAPRADGHAEPRTTSTGAQAHRSAMPEPDDQLEELPVRPVASRSARPGGLPADSRDHDGSESLGSRSLGSGSLGSGSLGSGRASGGGDGRIRPNDPLRLRADEPRLSGDPIRHPAGGLGRPSPSRSADFDDTRASGLGMGD